MARDSRFLTVTQNGDATEGMLIGPPFNLLSISVGGTFTATIALQRSFDRGATYETVESYTAPVAKNMEVAENQFVRLACTAYTNGSPTLRLGY